MSCMAKAFSPDASSLESEIDAALASPSTNVTVPSAGYLNFADGDFDAGELDFTEKQLMFVSVKDQQIQLLTGEVVRLRNELDSCLGYNKTPQSSNSTAAEADLRQEVIRLERELSSALAYNCTPDHNTAAALQSEHEQLQQEHQSLQREVIRLRSELDSVLEYNKTPAAMLGAELETIAAPDRDLMQDAYENLQETLRATSETAFLQEQDGGSSSFTIVSPGQWSNVTPSEFQLLPVTLETVHRDR